MFLRLVFLTFFMASAAEASPVQFSCDLGSQATDSVSESVTVEFSESSGDYSEIRYSTSGSRRSTKKRVLAKRARLDRSVVQPRAFTILAQDGSTLATLEVYGGTALQPLAHLLLTDGTRPCTISEGASSLFERLIDDPAMRTQIDAWNKWVNDRPATCDPAFQSIGYFQPGATKTALVLHGYSSNPHRMLDVIRVLLDSGYNVLAPRLSRHFTQDLHDLDNAKAAEWQRDAEESFALARRFSSSVTVVGYSLGGLLASRLALAHPTQIERLVLIAPAWKIRGDMSWGTMVGSFLGLSLNDLRYESPSCTIDSGYSPAVGGRQIERLIRVTEKRWSSGESTKQSAFAQLRVPHLVITSDSDEAVDSAAVNAICRTPRSVCTLAMLPEKSHTEMLTSLDVHASRPRSHMTMRELILGFLKR